MRNQHRSFRRGADERDPTRVGSPTHTESRASGASVRSRASRRSSNRSPHSGIQIEPGATCRTYIVRIECEQLKPVASRRKVHLAQPCAVHTRVPDGPLCHRGSVSLGPRFGQVSALFGRRKRRQCSRLCKRSKAACALGKNALQCGQRLRGTGHDGFESASTGVARHENSARLGLAASLIRQGTCLALRVPVRGGSPSPRSRT